MKTLKTLALLLSLVLLLAACGKTEPAAPDTAVPGTGADTPAVPEAPAEPEVPALTLGKLDGLVYTNDYCGFTLTLDDAWTVLPADQAQDLGGLVVENMEGTALEETIKKLPQFFDLMASRAADLSGINVIYQTVAEAEKILYANMTEEGIVDATLAASAVLQESYAQMGMTNVAMEKVQIEFLGETRTAMKTSADMYGMKYYVLQLFHYYGGDQMVILTLSAYNTDVTGDNLKLFAPVN